MKFYKFISVILHPIVIPTIGVLLYFILIPNGFNSDQTLAVLGLIFAQDAKLLILDDYSMGLDAGYRRLFIDYLKDYIKNTDKTVLITSHIMSDLVDLIDDIAIIQEGGKIYQSSMKDFIKDFKCYKVNNDEENQFRNIHRIEEYKDFKKIFTFENNNSLEELNIDFEDKFLGYVGKY